MVREEHASTLSEYFAQIRSICRTWDPTRSNEEVWFRGHAKRSYSLLPGLYRAEARAAKYGEEDLFERFKALAAGHPETPRVETDWEWYFVAQHFGLPTRLLDWSDSALAALFFAVSDHIERRSRPEVIHEALQPRREPIFDDESPTVWLLDAGTLNQCIFGTSSAGDVVVTVGGPRAQAYAPVVEKPITFEWRGLSLENRLPIAVLASRRSRRIVAQQGAFTVHGTDALPIEMIENPCLRLARIVFDRANLARLWEELEVAGVNRLALFPDLDNVARHIKWVCQSSTE